MRQVPPPLPPPRTARLRWAWPAYVTAAALLVYAVEKGWYATQGKLGLPGGPSVPESAYEQLPHVALRQWTLASAGLFGALLALATVLPWGRRVPRWIVLTLLWGALVPLLAGAPFVVHAVVTGGDPVGRQVLGVLRPVAQLGVWLAMTWSYQVRSRMSARPAEVG